VTVEIGRLEARAVQLALVNDYGSEAETVNRRIIELDPTNVPATTRLAKWLVKHQNTDEAIALYRRALELQPSNQIARNALTELLPKKPVGAKGVTRSKPTSIAGNPAVVVPVQEYYLRAMLEHPDELTTLNFGWHAGAGDKPKRLVEPERLCRQLGYLPFLFRATQQEDDASEVFSGEATHAGLAGIIVHGDMSQYTKLAPFLYQTRVERLVGYKRADELGAEIGTFYVVAALRELRRPIPYGEIELLSEARKLSPKFKHGYAIVDLPAELRDWQEPAVATWKRLSTSAGLEGLRNPKGVVTEWILTGQGGSQTRLVE
jgi:hypothetical protein